MASPVEDVQTRAVGPYLLQRTLGKGQTGEKWREEGGRGPSSWASRESVEGTVSVQSWSNRIQRVLTV